MLTLDQLISEATALSDVDKATLIEKIMESMAEQIEQDLLRQGVQKAQDRIAEIDSGAVSTIPGDLALAQISETLQRMKYEFHPAALQEYYEPNAFTPNRHLDGR
jgi:hypothetical protein